MNEIFTKIGGYIASGDTMVNHDNTLSGNGTVASPLGLNETVLWEGAPTASNNQIVVSKKFSNFDRVRIYWKSYERRYADEIWAGTNTGDPIVVGAVFVNPDGAYEKSMTRWNSTNGTTYTWAATIHGLFTGTQSNTWNSNVIPLKIVGINRKAQ